MGIFSFNTNLHNLQIIRYSSCNPSSLVVVMHLKLFLIVMPEVRRGSATHPRLHTLRKTEKLKRFSIIKTATELTLNVSKCTEHRSGAISLLLNIIAFG
jgi:hypothetical protein